MLTEPGDASIESRTTVLRDRLSAIPGKLAAAGVTLIFMSASVVAWHYYSEWRLGRVELITNGVPLVAQVLAQSSDDAIGEPFDLVTRAVVSLPDGEYRLRVNGMGRLGRTYRFAVNRGETQSHTVSLDEGRLLGGEPGAWIDFESRRREEPRPSAPLSVALELTRGKADLVEGSFSSLIRRDGLTGEVVWDALHPVKPYQVGRDPAAWMRALQANPANGAFCEAAPTWTATERPTCSGPSRSLLRSWPSRARTVRFSGTMPSISTTLTGPADPGPSALLETLAEQSTRRGYLPRRGAFRRRWRRHHRSDRHDHFLGNSPGNRATSQRPSPKPGSALRPIASNHHGRLGTIGPVAAELPRKQVLFRSFHRGNESGGRCGAMALALGGNRRRPAMART